MGSRPFSEISCAVCNNPVALSADLSADENGNAVHTECYLKRISTTVGRFRALRLRWQKKLGLDGWLD
jgi:hypothetical protein